MHLLLLLWLSIDTAKPIHTELPPSLWWGGTDHQPTPARMGLGWLSSSQFFV